MASATPPGMRQELLETVQACLKATGDIANSIQKDQREVPPSPPPFPISSPSIIPHELCAHCSRIAVTSGRNQSS